MRRAKFNEIRRDFSQSTSCHGLAQVYASTNKIQRIFWCLLVLAVLGMLVNQIRTRITEYTSFKTTTSISEKFVDMLDMPAITICNFNNFFNVNTQEERDAIDELANARADREVTPVDINKIRYFEGVYNGSIRSYAIDKGWQITDDTLIWCFTGDEVCTADNFTWTVTNMGKCWTFQQDLQVERAGSLHGVSIVLDVQQDGYTETYHNGNWEAGVKVQIHPHYDEPEVDQFGLAVPVGFMGFIGLRKKKEKKMFQPWGECDPNNEKLNFSSTYSTPNCFYECFRRELQEYCGCRAYYFDNSSLIDECTPEETVDCLANVSFYIKRYMTNADCGCQPPCQSTKYETKISYASLPNTAVQQAITQEENASYEYSRKNYVGITVYYESISYMEQEESQAITWSALLSDLGGQLGLWIGISVVTLFEITQFVFFYINEAMGMRNKTKVNSKDEERPQSGLDRNRNITPTA